MSVRDTLQEAIKSAMKNRQPERLDCLRMAKGAILMKEKSGATDLGDADYIAAIRSEVKKRHQSIDIFREHGKEEEAQKAEFEITVLEEFVPTRLSAEDLEAKVRAYATEHPEITHAGKLTGAMKKELGDSADGKMLNEVCRKILG
jgi:hypothetical protein